MNSPAAAPQPALKKELSLLDAAMLLVGGVIGSGIFLTAGQIATSLRRPDAFIFIWIAGGAISLLACFAVAELGGMFPLAGGQYVFLREAYGELPAFLYGWMIFAVVQTGTMAALAVGFAQYFGAVFPTLGSTHALLSVPMPFGWSALAITPAKLTSVAAIAGTTWANVVGLKRGSRLVNAATWLKFAAMAALVVLGLAFGHGDWSHFRTMASDPVTGAGPLAKGFGVALISVLFAFDGWVYITWVAAEIK